MDERRRQPLVRDPKAPRLTPLLVRVDETTGLPLLSSVLHDVEVLLKTNGYLGLVLIDFRPLGWIESEYGSHLYNDTIRHLAAAVGDVQRDQLRTGDLVSMARPYGEQILVFLEGPRGAACFRGQELEDVVDRLWLSLTPRVTELTQQYGRDTGVKLGYSLVLPNPMVQTERLIYRAIDEAAVMAQGHSHRVAARARERLRDLMVSQQLRIVYQPIIELSDLGVRGYEALVRGPEDSELVSPATLFRLASHANLVAEFAQACVELSLRNVQEMPNGSLLFVNVWPSLINDEHFRHQLLSATRDLDPGRLVLELFEGAAVHNHAILADSLGHLSSQGVQIAIDDLGVGHSNLDYILQLKPDFLKLDISLIQEIDSSIAKQAVVSSLVSIGNAVDATVIAEGVESSSEHQKIAELQVPWAQGFHFARPSPEFWLPRGS